MKKWAKEAVHQGLLLLQTSACKAVLQSDSWCCKTSGERRAVAQAMRPLWRCSWRAGLIALAAVFWARHGHYFHLLSVLLASRWVQWAVFSCKLRSKALPQVHTARRWHAGNWKDPSINVTCDGSCILPSITSVVTASCNWLQKLCSVKTGLNLSVVISLFFFKVKWISAEVEALVL